MFVDKALLVRDNGSVVKQTNSWVSSYLVLAGLQDLLGVALVPVQLGVLILETKDLLLHLVVQVGHQQSGA